MIPGTVTGVVCYIGLGSNLNQPAEQVRKGGEALAAMERVCLRKLSSLYCTKPLTLSGQHDGQPDYVNAVAEIVTDLSCECLLDALQAVELEHGRVRTAQRWEARTLDLDILLYGQSRINNERLTVPHAGLKDRDFVLYPLCEIASNLTVPGLGQVKELKQHCKNRGILRVKDKAGQTA